MMDGAQVDMELSRLFPGLVSCPPQVDVSDVATHSGEVSPGSLFLACAGTRQHGLRFLGDALDHGARAVAWEPAEGVSAPALPADVTGLAVPGLRGRLGAIANEFFASPSAELSVAGITGTNGKTTVAWLLVQALERLGRRAGYMGTLGVGLGTEVTRGELTTPGCINVHRMLRQFADAGAGDVAMEVSSHALDQGRVDGVAFRVAAFTNLTRDHLDYHGDLESYARAKERLFLEHRVASAVINISDDFGRQLAGRLPAGVRLVSVGVGAQQADLVARRLAGGGAGQRVGLHHAGDVAEFSSPLIGAFNIENLAITAGILVAEGFGLQAVAAALAGCTAPAGRMELIKAARGPRVVVDFAHTPDALRRALEALRSVADGRLWCVFGCGGERDAGKRAPMGAIARELADHVIITDDNPRGEDPERIVEAILEGTGRGPAVSVIHDRAAAIEHAIRGAQREDIVLVAGKGHESVQIEAAVARPFSDQAAALKALAGRP